MIDIKNKFLLFLIGISFSICLQAQKTDKIDFEYLDQIAFPEDSTAVAAFIEEACRVRYDLEAARGLNLELDYHYKIKIYKEAGEEYGEFEIPLYINGSSRESIRNIKGYTVSKENGKISVLKLEKKNIYREKTADYLTTVKFALPNVKAGSVIDIRYKIVSPFAYTIPKWYFQNRIPTIYSEYHLRIPAYFGLTPIASGFIPLDIEEKKGFSNDDERTLILKAKNVAAIKDDDFVLNINDYRGGIKYEIHSVHFPNSSIRYFSKDWQSIAKNLSVHPKFGKQLKVKLKDLNPIIEEAMLLPESDRLTHIYDYVRTHYTWNKEYGLKTDGGIKNLVKTKVGNAAEINLLLINLLNKIGVAAKPFALKTRRNGLMNNAYPSLSELNYVIAHVPKENGFILLDATSPNIPAGILPSRAVNINGLLISKDAAEVIHFKNPNIYKVRSNLEFEIDLETPSLVGKGKTRKINHAAIEHRNKHTKKEERKETEEEEEEEEEEIAIEDEREIIETKNLEDIYKPIEISFNEKKYSCIKHIGDQIFINADLNYGLQKNPFTQEKREFSIFYKNRVDLTKVISLNIPQGYEAETIPELLKIELADKKGKFTYEVKNINNKLIIYYILKINADIFSPDEYADLKLFYDKIIDKQKEKIVFKKV